MAIAQSHEVSSGESAVTLDAVAMRRAVDQGVKLCRGGEMEDGYSKLRAVAQGEEVTIELPGTYYSYLGLCIAGFEGRYNEGVKLCKKGIEVEFFQPENYLNLARVYMMLKSRRKAIRAIRDGLRVDPRNRMLILLRRELGVRKKPVVPFLHRDNGINQLLGRWRHRLNEVPGERRDG